MTKIARIQKQYRERQLIKEWFWRRKEGTKAELIRKRDGLRLRVY